MLYIVFKSGYEQPWHIGEKELCEDQDEISNVECIEADCDELTKIKDLFGSTLPMSSRPVQAWYGDIARSIVFALWS